MKQSKDILCIFLFLLPFWTCSEEESLILHEELVFTNAFQIKIPMYQYDTLGITYTIRGDSGYRSPFVDTLNGRPCLKWDATGIPIITAAIFDQPIEVSGGEIINIENIIWQWHSGMEFGNEGDLQYFEGRNVLHNNYDTIDYQNPARPLDEGHYYWAVWGWDRSGVWIWYSSRQMEFYVSE